MELNLCSSCEKCPKVIAEEGNLVRLRPSEWNTLVDGIKTGKLSKI